MPLWCIWRVGKTSRSSSLWIGVTLACFGVRTGDHFASCPSKSCRVVAGSLPLSKTRTFIAVDAVDAVQVAALQAIDRLRSATESVKWVEPDNLHWTMQFLGDLTDQEMAEVCLRTTRAAARHESFELAARGVG